MIKEQNIFWQCHLSIAVIGRSDHDQCINDDSSQVIKAPTPDPGKEALQLMLRRDQHRAPFDKSIVYFIYITGLWLV
jgi:hypothetical protein